MSNQPRGCLAFLFGFGGSKPVQPTIHRSPEPKSGEEGNYHSGPGGYEGMGYSGGYAADYFNDSDDSNEGDENH